ncbi:putative aminotransferase class I and II family protein [Daldinia caldariorum]|uniref:putative aminotransferase class I and II family protein n=1 Tax=Daldinia caldariorum TaxID=326644 RepID=UPI0020085C83|nr:putative aminotransferase class I and II family protein [Daldinia caldariorum]KAI1463629.1 putative aminotransferase class I and II family protein [Daldinia caldariorum]
MASSISQGLVDEAVAKVFLGVAENLLLYEDISTFIKNNLTISPDDQFGYGVGPRGSPRLKKALTSSFQNNFDAERPIREENLLILPGVGGALDALAWSICDDGEGIIIPVPFWSGISQGVGERTRGVMIPAIYQSIEGYQGLDDLFDPEINKKALEKALQQATKDNVKVKGVMLCNPHNPLGRCCPVETLREIAGFCGQHNLHLISDEVFAMSVYDNLEVPDTVPFTSVLALDLEDKIDPRNVHVAYGMGKDFCAARFRIGVLHSRNEAEFLFSVLGWVPYIVQDMWASILTDDEFRIDFMHKNRRLLAEHSEILTAFLREYDIPYYSKVNAGVFAWVSLQRYLRDKSEDSATNSFKSNGQFYREREMTLWDRLLASGVGLGLGGWYSSEEPGWFRISFAVEKEALRIGLERLIKTLRQVEAEGWK